MRIVSLLILIIGLTCSSTQAKNLRDLARALDSTLKTKDATVGIGLRLIESGDTLSINPARHFPMQSVYKFHLALTVLSMVDEGRFALDQMIAVKAREWDDDTWSPLAERVKYKSCSLRLDTLLAAMVSESDNNACDILFRLVGGPRVVEQFLRKHDIQNVNIRTTELQMHKKEMAQYENWTTPGAAVEVLTKWYTHALLSPQCYNVLLNLMLNSQNPANRIKAGLPAGVKLAHKTGTSGHIKKRVVACNDIGVITLPSGQHLALAVFVHNSALSDADSAALIAQLSAQIWKYFVSDWH